MLKIAFDALLGMILSVGAFDGRAACILALPENDTELQRSAADELKHFLDQGSGCSFTIKATTFLKFSYCHQPNSCYERFSRKQIRKSLVEKLFVSCCQGSSFLSPMDRTDRTDRSDL